MNWEATVMENTEDFSWDQAYHHDLLFRMSLHTSKSAAKSAITYVTGSPADTG